MVKRPSGKPHRFGGDWTNAKLAVLAEYLRSYTTALKKTPFTTAYIDAFAGTGYREERPKGEDGGRLLLPDLAEEEPQALLDGSARLALKTSPPFDRFLFIEQNEARCQQLELLRAEFPDLGLSCRSRG